MQPDRIVHLILSCAYPAGEGPPGTEFLPEFADRLEFLDDGESSPYGRRCEKVATFRLRGAVAMESGVVLRLDSRRQIPELIEIELNPFAPYAYTVYPQNILGKRADTLAALGVELVK